MNVVWKTEPITDKCVILDIDETLVHTMETAQREKLSLSLRPPSYRSRIYDFTVEGIDGKRGSGETYRTVGFKRPGLEDFLDFCFNYFKVVTVWSAGVRPYVEGVVRYAFRNVGMPHIVYSREQCVPVPDSPGDLHKPISEMIGREASLKGIMTLQNTLFIDDQSRNGSSNEGNFIAIPEYEPEPSALGILEDDGAFYRLKKWLLSDEVRFAPDVTVLDKERIFADR